SVILTTADPHPRRIPMFPALLALSLFAPAADPPKDKELSDAAKKELKKLEGKWQLVKLTAANGEIEPGPNDPAPVLEFKGRKVFFDGKEAGEVTDLDPSVD